MRKRDREIESERENFSRKASGMRGDVLNDVKLRGEGVTLFLSTLREKHLSAIAQKSPRVFG